MPKVIKFETIKKNAVAEFIGRAGGPHRSLIGNATDPAPFLALYAAVVEAAANGKRTDPAKKLDEWIAEGVRRIENWDVRCVKKLIALFPSSVPKSLADRPITCEIEDTPEGHWVCIFN